ncbi:hypothetical protein V8G54_005495 [Vigna mungo]|uniref:Uncharacterized protein n=1 Tax=Vigna mungo TaxID=3915 RepID=A0AAQ3P1M3_VIGMU
MADLTRLQAAMREQEERLENKIISKQDERFMEITASIRQAIEASVDRRILETLHRTSKSANDALGRSPNSRGACNSISTYSCGTRLARIDFSYALVVMQSNSGYINVKHTLRLTTLLKIFM